MLAKDWLLQNNYKAIAKLIDEVVVEWKVQGKATRRNWWEILAGDTNGNPRIVGTLCWKMHSPSTGKGKPVRR